MSISGIVCLIAITGAFALFAVVLAWGEHQTRDIVHSARKRPASTDAGVATLKHVAEAREPVHAA
ncbi:MAG: hypothetical protein WCA56_11295 [Xanthobacteraceae bacterium]|jgi:hypothetical protein